MKKIVIEVETDFFDRLERVAEEEQIPIERIIEVSMLNYLRYLEEKSANRILH